MKAKHALTMALLVSVVATLGAQSSGTVKAPVFEVDPLWPKPPVFQNTAALIKKLMGEPPARAAGPGPAALP